MGTVLDVDLAVTLKRIGPSLCVFSKARKVDVRVDGSTLRMLGLASKRVRVDPSAGWK